MIIINLHTLYNRDVSKWWRVVWNTLKSWRIKVCLIHLNSLHYATYEMLCVYIGTVNQHSLLKCVYICSASVFMTVMTLVYFCAWKPSKFLSQKFPLYYKCIQYKMSGHRHHCWFSWTLHHWSHQSIVQHQTHSEGD